MPELLDVLDKFGVIGVLFIIVWGALKRWWVPGWLYEQERQEKEEFKDLALKSVTIAEKTLEKTP